MTGRYFLALLAPPLASALIAWLVRPYRATVGVANGVLSLVSLLAALGFAGRVLAGEDLTWGPGEILRVDALSALLAVCVASVGALAAWLGPGIDADPHYDAAQTRSYRIFANLFVFTMLAAVTSNNVAVMWVAIEATTIVSAVLIPLTVTKASVEASWKYILIGSVGIALAFAGTVLAYFDVINVAGPGESALNWTWLMARAPHLHPEVVQLAFVFLLVGYGTKAGIAPMHTWLPDAHSEAPAPLSAMMSGVLLAVAVYAILRWKAVVAASPVGSSFSDGLLIALGLFSLAIAALSLVIQRHYKRLLAYSSIEQTGLICLGLGLGPLGIFAAMLQLLNHTFTKSMMFFLSGRILDHYHSTEIVRVSGLLRTMPATGGLFAAGMLALVGLPPFGIFLAKFTMVRAGFAAGRPWLMAAVLVFLAIAFIALIAHLNRMLYGAVPAGVVAGERRRWALVPLALCLAIVVVLGLTVPGPVEALLSQIVEIAVSQPGPGR